MKQRKHNQRLKRLVASAFLLALTLRIADAQTSSTPAFDVASIRPNNSGADAAVDTNVPLGPGDVYSPIGGLFRAVNFPLISYIAFAWKMNDGQLAAFKSAAPEWVMNDRFDIQARTDETAVTKDGLRLRMQSLLADRFGLTVHHEERRVDGYAMVLARPNSVGPKLRPHPAVFPCPTALPAADAHAATPPEHAADGFPATCGGLVRLPAEDGHIRIGSSDVPLRILVAVLPGWGGLGRPVVDATGLTGRYDYVLDFVWRGALNDPNVSGPNFQQALKEQLGLKLVSQKIESDIIVLDRIGPLRAN